MKRILLLSDTHGCEEADIVKHFGDADELWHAGDWGNAGLLKIMQQGGQPVRSVWGNIDGQDLRLLFPEHNRFECEGVKVWMTHIGGYPGHYPARIAEELRKDPPQIFICGHSHILRVMRDQQHRGVLVMNPGAAGRHGFHVMRTMLKFELDAGAVKNVAVIELGKRTAGIVPE